MIKKTRPGQLDQAITDFGEPESITVFMTPEQAALFVLFQEHYDNIAYLLSQRVFDLPSSNFSVHLDQDSRIKSIKKELFIYRNPRE